MRLRLIVILFLALLVAACGTEAEPRPTFEPTTTSNPRLVLEDEGEEAADQEAAATTEAVAVVPTVVEPTATPIPPTSTPEPTLAPTEEHTNDHEHTAEPTAEATEEHADDHAHATEEPAGVEINGLIGDPEKGFEVFNYFPNPDPNAAQKFCAACHSADEPVIKVGPYLYGIASREHGGTHTHGDQSELIAYLHESIVDPNAQLALPQLREDGTEAVWSPGLMPQNWGEVLSEQQIADLIAYLLTLNQEMPE